ncbi:type I toxin-antitoxin system Fst family toxin [Staphylococcus epidermidis]|nr:type I toxin-antitoxin system Fst family toxin [Staphylococcus epidermidis]MCG1473715.1 type I toxin-antitoxin system Fst family toxin [Staphylococcus epidermidis]MCG1655095.1 type I toxin-antitoxin system Fst family toxin [Staphylococcus epidermidis]MCG1664515.1 type I toxin-antitoxin system Fst family toxin [Staphylococcus epidermidis]MCG1707053.1 type I toxin-antitoxin system Fst family toxin [Staphylococcus epidermidis]
MVSWHNSTYRKLSIVALFAHWLRNRNDKKK